MYSPPNHDPSFRRQHLLSRYHNPAATSVRRRVDHQRQNPSIHALPNVPLTENFSSFGFVGHPPRNATADGGAMGISEPNSPFNGEGIDHNSNETHSSGEHTKTNSRSPSGHRVIHPHGREHGDAAYGQYHRETINSPFFSRHPAGGLRWSHSRNHHPSAHPSAESLPATSPAYGRYRQGAYGADGLESGRASTIGTDTGFNAGIPHNSSRTALNNEWRNSELGSQDGVTFADEKYSPGNYPTKDISEDLQDSGPTYIPIPPSSPAEDEKKASRISTDGVVRAPPVVVSRQNRLEWIDGIRGLASLVIFTHHFSDLTWAQSHPDTLSQGVYTVSCAMANWL
ncbi:hypothetical protein H4Q26_007788 [Puccinia striiformis f. sp. tritici PST-130]|nr:hypothetical protein H4Q26_007788 [Puccinia striiformis f. sp. tritici PST-130]